MKEQIDQMVSEGCPHGHDAHEAVTKLPVVERTSQHMVLLDERPAERWAFVEIFGHRSHYGRLVEIEQFGSKMLRIDVPTEQPDVFQSFEYGGGAIFSIKPMTEKAVREAQARHREMYGVPSRTILEDQEEEEERF